MTAEELRIENERRAVWFKYLSQEGPPYKIPYIKTVTDLADIVSAKPITVIGAEGPPSKESTWAELRDIALKIHTKTNEKTIQVYQRAQTIANIGRLRGNMEYLEDCWNVQIQPITFKYAYAGKGKLELTDSVQAKIRDKYLKIRVRYDGKQYVMVNAIKTNYTISYA